MRHETLATELVRSLRGPRSQTSLSRRLGYATNVVYAWEAGRRFPAATDFLRLAARSRVDLRGGLLRFWAGVPGFVTPTELTTRAGVVQLLAHLRRQYKLAELARRTGTSRLTLARWFSGAAEPRLPDLLRLIEAATQRLLEFVAVFVDPERLPSVRRAYRDMQAQLRVAYELPWSHAVLRALELHPPAGARRGRDRPSLAAQLGISPEHERECLRALSRAKQIRRVRGRLRSVRVLTVDTRSDPERNRMLKVHWARVALERLERRAEGDLFSYSLFAVSEADYQRLRALHAAYFEQMRAIVRASVRPERVVLANVQLLSLVSG
jgi:transcriptional regulator with XRE-family HTH domain